MRNLRATKDMMKRIIKAIKKNTEMMIAKYNIAQITINEIAIFKICKNEFLRFWSIFLLIYLR